MGRLTAALIVRNESGVIEDCLESLAGHVDEIVLVDTGSRDDTIEKARRFPIQLHHFDWCDDFSAARNFAIERSKGEWILYIDADERLAVPRSDMLADILADKRKVAWTLRFHPRVDWTPYSELRLFRNDPRIRFRGTIHERLQEGIDLIQRTDSMETGDCDLTIQHVGYESDQAYKNARNIPLLRAEIEHDPEHLYSWWHLGECLLLSGDEEGAIAVWSQGANRAQSLPAAMRRLSDAQSVVSLVRLLIRRGMDASELLRDALKLYPEHLSLRWMEATLALQSGNIAVARPTLETIAAIDPDSFYDRRVSYDKAMFRHLAKEALALCHFRTGNFSEAAELYRSAARHSPDGKACEIKARLADQRFASLSRGFGHALPNNRFNTRPR